MRIREIIKEALKSSVLTQQQESAINTILWEKAYDLSDLEALDELIEAIIRQEVQTSSPLTPVAIQPLSGSIA
ncbi:MAG: hypothetical protein Q6L60_09795 [Thermostichus sp. HHBFW_bins_43]